MTTEKATLGHNNPPTDEQVMAERLGEKHNESLEKGRELMKQAAALPAVAASDEDEAALTEWVKASQLFMRDMEKLRTDEKKPYLDAGRHIDTFFKRPSDAFTAAKAKIEARILTWKRAKAAEEAKRREDQARLEREAAAKAKETAEALKEVGDDKAAAVVEKQAARAEQKADRLDTSVAAGTGLASSKTASGVSSGLVKRWVGEPAQDTTAVIDLEALRPYLKPDHIQVAINAAVAAGVREIKGVKIYQKEGVSVR